MNTSDQKTHRRLAAIVNADIVGFSTMMGADEAGTHEALSRAMALCSDVVSSFDGRVVSTAGDAFLAEFPSIVQATSAAVALQTQTFASTGHSAHAQIHFRIGINIGDVIADGEDIFGDGVNVAARVQAMAPPGGIALTGAAHDQLGNRSDIIFLDSGEHRLKNIEAPVRIYVAQPPFEAKPAKHATQITTAIFRSRLGLSLIALILIGLSGFFASNWLPIGQYSSKDVPQTKSRPVLAVLPFREVGVSVEEGYFADGFTEDIIAHLGQFSELIVLSWNAVSPYRERRVEIPEVRRNLNARYVIGGTIRRQDDRLRLSVQLTDARDGTLVWSEQYEGSNADVFQLQDKITGTAAGALALGVGQVEQRLAQAQPTEALSAYDLVLRGRFAMRRVDREANLEARDYFEGAIILDPRYADAHAELAWTYVNDVWWGWSEWPQDTIETGEKLARQALNISPENVAALSALAELHWMKNDLQSARDYCKSAVRQNANDARAHASCAGVLTFSGAIDEGIEHGELTLRLDPEPSSWLFTNLAIAYFFRERYEDAVLILNRSAHFIDEDPAPHAVLAASYVRLGRESLAKKEVDLTLRLHPFFNAETFAGNLSASGLSHDLLDALHNAGFQ